MPSKTCISAISAGTRQNFICISWNVSNFARMTMKSSEFITVLLNFLKFCEIQTQLREIRMIFFEIPRGIQEIHNFHCFWIAFSEPRALWRKHGCQALKNKDFWKTKSSGNSQGVSRKFTGFAKNIWNFTRNKTESSEIIAVDVGFFWNSCEISLNSGWHSWHSWFSWFSG